MTCIYQSNAEMYIYFTLGYHINHPSIHSSIVMVCGAMLLQFILDLGKIL